MSLWTRTWITSPYRLCCPLQGVCSLLFNLLFHILNHLLLLQWLEFVWPKGDLVNWRNFSFFFDIICFTNLFGFIIMSILISIKDSLPIICTHFFSESSVVNNFHFLQRLLWMLWILFPLKWVDGFMDFFEELEQFPWSNIVVPFLLTWMKSLPIFFNSIFTHVIII